MMQKGITQVFVLLFALSGLTCPCTASTAIADDGGAHQHHQMADQAVSPVGGANCEHADCSGCDSQIGPASDSNTIASPAKSKADTDKFNAIPPAPVIIPSPVVTTTSTGPPTTSHWRPSETPVQLNDLLLE